MRRDELYLIDIVEAADAIAAFLQEKDERRFAGDDLLRSAVLLKLIIIGEAAARLSSDLKSRHPEIEWADVIGFRNIAVHAYFGIQWPIVWVTARDDIPGLRAQVLRIVQENFPETFQRMDH